MPNTSLMIFDYANNVPVRTHIDGNGESWFVAQDVCDILGLENNRRVLMRLEDDEKGVTISNTLGGPQNMNTVNESGLYALIFTSIKPEAIAFRRWVTHEVLPALRQTGRYEIQRDSLLLGEAEGIQKRNAELIERCTFQHVLSNARYIQENPYRDFIKLIKVDTVYDIRLLRETFITMTGLNKDVVKAAWFKHKLVKQAAELGWEPGKAEFSNTIKFTGGQHVYRTGS